jgi:hypothetical protein
VTTIAERIVLDTGVVSRLLHGTLTNDVAKRLTRSSAARLVGDRRRIELIQPGLSAAPIHWERRRLDVVATVALVQRMRASVVRTASAALDEIATGLPKPIVPISLRTWPPDFPGEIAKDHRMALAATIVGGGILTPSPTLTACPTSHGSGRARRRQAISRARDARCRATGSPGSDHERQQLGAQVSTRSSATFENGSSTCQASRTSAGVIALGVGAQHVGALTLSR